MKRIIILIMIMSLMLCSGAVAENDGNNLDFITLTGLDELSQKLDSGITINRVYYTDGYGFSTSEFTTTDEAEIHSLWTALNQITVKGQVNESITDWYPQIVFYLSDETTAHVTFESHWLSLPTPWPQANYELENDDAFWSLTASLVNKYENMPEEPVDGGWSAASDPTITDEVRALFDKATEGLLGVNYVPIVYLGSQIVAGYCHAILCQATTVYPGAEPRWVIVYLFEDLDGGVTVTNIMDLNW